MTPTSMNPDPYSPGFMPKQYQFNPLEPPTGMEYPEGVLPKSSCVTGTKPFRPLSYLASPYSHPNKNVMATRYVLATEAAAWLILKMKWNVFAPITHSHPLATLGGLAADWTFWKKIDTEYIQVSERLVVLELDGWRQSVGVQAEIELARKFLVPVVYMRPVNHVGGGKSYDLAPYPMDEVGALKEDTCYEWESTSIQKVQLTKPEADAAWEKALRRSDGPYQCPPDCPPEGSVPSCPTSKAETANPKDLIGSQKVSLSKVPAVAIAHCAHAMMDGAKKYDPYNWRAKKVQAHIYVDAAFRHIMDWFEGEEDAPDSKVHHLGHAMACCAILLDCQETGNLIDDRPITTSSRGIMARVLERLRQKITNGS